MIFLFYLSISAAIQSGGDELVEDSVFAHRGRHWRDDVDQKKNTFLLYNDLAGMLRENTSHLAATVVTRELLWAKLLFVWLVDGVDLFLEKSIVVWLPVADLF
jgi:hypothetical protein